MDIEKVASENPEKIITNKIDIKKQGPDKAEIEEIIFLFNFDKKQKIVATKLIKSLYFILLEKDASLIEINPLIVTKEKNNLFRCKNEF